MNKIYKHTDYCVDLRQDGFYIGCQFNTFDDWLNITNNMWRFADRFISKEKYKKAVKAITIKKFIEFIKYTKSIANDSVNFSAGDQFTIAECFGQNLEGLNVKWVSGGGYSNQLMEGHNFIFVNSEQVISETNHDDEEISSFLNGDFYVHPQTVLEVL